MFYESIYTSSSDRKHNNMHRLNTISDVFEVLNTGLQTGLLI